MVAHQAGVGGAGIVVADDRHVQTLGFVLRAIRRTGPEHHQLPVFGPLSVLFETEDATEELRDATAAVRVEEVTRNGDRDVVHGRFIELLIVHVALLYNLRSDGALGLPPRDVS
jgi:hypothetical protein